MNLREKLLKGELVAGTWLQTGDVTVAEVMAECGWDFIAADMEHTAIDNMMFVEFARAIKGMSVPLARVESDDTLAIRRVLDLGAEGVIVPMVNTKEQAEKIVQAAKYAPEGSRGFAYIRANKQGVEFDEYARTANDRIIVIAMIETKEGVDNIDSILSVDGIDGVFIGPYDMSGSYGVVGQTNHPFVTNAKALVLEACKKHNKIAGQHLVNASKEQVSQAVNDGYTFIALETDTIFLNRACRESISYTKGL